VHAVVLREAGRSGGEITFKLLKGGGRFTYLCHIQALISLHILQCSLCKERTSSGIPDITPDLTSSVLKPRIVPPYSCIHSRWPCTV
jgi:hypothetical protein